MTDVSQLRTNLERLKGQKIQVRKSLIEVKQEFRDAKKSLHLHEKAKEVIRIVGLETQQKLQFHISDITSLALEAVFPDPYELKANFVQRRNKTECDLTFVRDEMEIDPIEASGVGAIDVAAFALRIASWSMNIPHTRNTIILDEPFRFLSKNYQEQASMMIKEISQKLGIQMLIVTHETALTESADKIFNISIKNGISKINEL